MDGHALLLPPDIVLEILFRLSVKTLSRLRCVCKQWYALISDPFFQQLHHRRSKENPHLLITCPSRDREDNTTTLLQLSSINFKDGSIQEEMILSKVVDECYVCLVTSSSCLDLVCLVAMLRVYLCNPATGELLTLPEFSLHGDYRDMGSVALGHVPSSKEYKVVRFFSHYPEFEPEFEQVCVPTCEVFTLGSDHWRVVEFPPFPLAGNAPFINGAIHLMADFEYYDHDNDVMVAFDVKEEKFQVFTPPGCCSDPQRVAFRPDMVLMELDGLLCLADFGDIELQQVDLWLLKDYENRVWMKEYNIDLSRYNDYDWYNYDAVFPKTIVDGRILMQMPGIGRKLELVYYDPQSQKFTNFELEVSFQEAGLYVQSFLSLGSR